MVATLVVVLPSSFQGGELVVRHEGRERVFDFGTGTAKTTYGTCGVKVWVFKGEILAHDPMAQDKRLNEQQQQTTTRSERANA